jgi:isorenieratene synthase
MASAVVVGGGLAGVAAAVLLGERGISTTLIEQENFLGGRAGAWSDTLSDGTSFQMERGFHAFFRQYYNLRSLLKRVDPALRMLRPVSDYPLLSPSGEMESFARLPKRSPFNVMELVRRSKTIRLLDFRHVNLARAREMLAFDATRTYGAFDTMSAKSFLDGLNFPEDARRVLFDVFAHSFFNPEEHYSAAELLAMFHYYFTQNPEGLLFDVMNAPFSTAFWNPMLKYLHSLGVSVQLGTSVLEVARSDGSFRVRATRDDRPLTFEASAVVLATSVPGLKKVVERSEGLAALRPSINSLDVTSPFAVQRLWLDRKCWSYRPAFAGTTGFEGLDNISLYEQLESESRVWSERTGGSVVELHAYALPGGSDEETVKRRFLEGLHTFYPETKDAKIIEQRFLMRQDCPSFAPGSFATRPTVTTSIENLVLAGDYVKLPFPSALMERATSSGFIAANHLLQRFSRPSEPVRHGPLKGVFAALAS